MRSTLNQDVAVKVAYTELEHYKWDLGYKEVSLGILIYFIYFVVMLNGCSKLQSHLTKNHVSKLYCMMISMIFVFKHCLGGFEKGDTIWNLNNILCNTRVCIIVNVHVVSFLKFELNKMLMLLLRWAKETSDMSLEARLL